MTSSNSASTYPSKLLRLESLVLFIITLYAYYRLDGSWLVFILVLFAFDISMVGYLVNDKIGGAIYNFGHSFIFSSLLLLVGWANDIRWMALLSIIWLAHISLDRALGYGLKLHDFHHTHLGVIGRSKPD